MMKKTIFIFLVFALSFALIAEPDNGAFVSTSPFNVRNFYADVRPQLRLPLVFFYDGQRLLSPIGPGVVLSLGYNLDGWLFSLQGGYGYFGKFASEYATVLYFNQATVGASVSKIFGKSLIPVFPAWFSFAPELGAGLSIIQSEYLQPDSLFEDNIRLKETGYSSYVYVGLYALFPFHEAITPYIGYGNTIQFVLGSVVYSGSFDIGVRVYPFAFEKQKK